MLIQVQVLIYLMTSKDTKFLTTNGINADYFPDMKSEFYFVYNYFKEYGTFPDIATFVNKFTNFEIIEVTDSPKYLLKELRRNKNDKFTRARLNKIRELLITDKTDESISEIKRLANDLSYSDDMNAVNILEDTSRLGSYIDKCSDFDKYYIPTGFPELDRIIGGFDRNEEYATIAARSGQGKSWVLLKCITAALNKGLRVGLYSGEMSVEKVGYRFDTLMGHISNGMLMHGNRMAMNQYKEYIDNLSSYHKGELYVLTPDMVGGKCTVDTLRGFIEKYDLQALYVDQHSLLYDSQNAKTSFEKAANISKDIKLLQVTKHIPIITVSQQNREKVEDGKHAGTENISQSDRISQDSTLIMFIELKDNIMSLIIGKSRDGGTGETLKYEVNIDKGTWIYIDESEDSEDSEERAEAIRNVYSNDLQPIEEEDLPF